MAIILAFGASITYGSGDCEHGGWVGQIRQYLDQHLPKDQNNQTNLIYNLGISGETSEGLLKRFTQEANRRVLPTDQVIILFCSGGNDAAFIPSEQRFRISPTECANNFQQLFNQAKTISKSIAFLTITPVRDEITGNRPGKDRQKLNRYVEEFNACLLPVCEKPKIKVIDVYNRFQQGELSALISADGVHPTPAGHKLIFEMVQPWLTQQLSA